MKKIFLFLFLSCSMLSAFAQTTSTASIEVGAKNAAQDLLAVLKLKNKKALEKYLMDVESLRTLAQNYNFSSQREKTNFLRNIDSYHSKMLSKVKKSMDEALLEISNAGLSVNSLSIKSSKVELKKDSNLPTTVVTLILSDGSKDHTMFIEGLAFYNSQWYLNEGFNWWK